MKFIKLIPVVLILLVLLASKAEAFSIFPASYNLFTVDPGAGATAKIKIINEESKGMSYRLRVLGVKQDAQGKPVFIANSDIAETWVKPEFNNVTIGAGKSKEVNFFISVPPDASAGSHYLALAVEPILGEGGQTKLSGQLVSLLPLQVGGTVNESLEITKWNLVGKDFQKGVLKFDVEVKNNGSVETPMEGAVAIKDWRGQELFSDALPLGNKLLAGAIRAVQPAVNLGNNKLSPGAYQAQLSVVYGKTRQITAATAYFWYLPGWVWLAGAGILAVLTLVIIFSLRIIRKRV